MTEKETYFAKGYLTKDFRQGPTLDRLNDVFRELRVKEPRKPYRWEEKYAFSADLRPDIFSYDEVFLDILFDNGIPSLLNELAGADMRLAHIQLRHAFQGESYMDWHRDTHFYQGDLHGSIPPVHKVIFYPRENGPPGLRLKVSPGSHLRYFGNRFLDRFQARVAKAENIMSSNKSFLVFNTSILHAAAAEKSRNGAYRLIYTFCRDFQIDLFQDQAGLHQEYRRRAAAVRPGERGILPVAAPIMPT